ncbi:N-acetylglucosamine kinase [Vibrio pectenicida]|uniref:N-acetylglucosamine kinase n=1 Tax=Vibrio pectenicida TaxID=62763 RepID=A0A427U335_9VIBR|nr:N-acetylglucosamine kinase [Vibrio pectenicida]RSD31035.1 N-acetylglucosamine kinase [Vibrio pectenicida]
MSHYYVGVDGGGTCCRARIKNHHGKLVGEAKSGSANILLGVGLALNSVIEAVTNAANNAGLDDTQLPLMHLGLALAGAEHKAAWYEFMSQPHPFASAVLNTDAYGACLGAHNGHSGAIVIAGTGSCGLYLSGTKQHVVGGHEFPISDQGGGAIMGLRLIQQVILASDNMRDKTPLFHDIIEHFNHDISEIVIWSKQALPRDYGQFSPLIFRHAAQGDPLAMSLLKQTASDIEMLIQALVKKGATQICLMGSIAERIGDWLAPDIHQWLSEPLSDALEGALMFAEQPQHNLYSRRNHGLPS